MTEPSLPEGWKFREMAARDSGRKDKEFLAKEGFVFRYKKTCKMRLYNFVSQFSDSIKPSHPPSTLSHFFLLITIS